MNDNIQAVTIDKFTGMLNEDLNGFAEEANACLLYAADEAQVQKISDALAAMGKKTTFGDVSMNDDQLKAYLQKLSAEDPNSIVIFKGYEAYDGKIAACYYMKESDILAAGKGLVLVNIMTEESAGKFVTAGLALATYRIDPIA